MIINTLYSKDNYKVALNHSSIYYIHFDAVEEDDIVTCKEASVTLRNATYETLLAAFIHVQYSSDLETAIINEHTNGNDNRYTAYQEWRTYCEGAARVIFPLEETLENAKATMIAKIDAYDTSTSVNGFTVNGTTMWFNKADRVGLMNSTQILKDAGETNCTLWGTNVSYTIPCDTLITMLSQLEVYALNCYNVTAQHKQEVEALTTIEEVNTYDYTSGYPTQLAFTIE